MRASPERRISAGAMIGLALGILILPLKWLTSAVAAGLFHEFCHWAAICLCGGAVSRFRIGGGGAVMAAERLSRGKEMICSLAGPVGGLLLLFAAKWFPVTAVCALVQSAYNLLPIYPLDGGRAVRCAALMLLSPKTAIKVAKWLERLCVAAICAASVYAAVCLHFGVLPLALAGILLIKKNSLQRDPNESTMEVLFQKG